MGQAVSLSGTWMQNLAQSWLVYRLTESELLVGAVGFCAHAPVLLLGPLAGIVADRHSRHRIVIFTQVTFLLQSALLAWLTLTDRIVPAHVFLLAASWGIINAFDVPARQSLYIHMVGREDLINAISLNAVTFNTARFIGPAIAGLIIAGFGEGVCFLVNCATFLAVIVSLLMLRLPPTDLSRVYSPWAHLREGFRYVGGRKSLLALLGINSATSISRAPAFALAPFFADAIFHRGSRGLGILTGAAGIGAVAGSLGLARRTHAKGLPDIVFYSALGTGACLVAFSWSPAFALSIIAFLFLGFSQMRQNASSNTTIQTLIPDEYRGRIMALYSMTILGVQPLGHLAGGAIAESIGPRWTVCAGGIACLFGALVFSRARLRIHSSLERATQEP